MLVSASPEDDGLVRASGRRYVVCVRKCGSQVLIRGSVRALIGGFIRGSFVSKEGDPWSA